MSLTPCSQQLGRDRDLAPFGHARARPWARRSSGRARIEASTARSGSSIRARRSSIDVEDDGLARVAEQVGRRRGLLDHGAVRRQVSAQDHGSALGVQRLVERQDHFGRCRCAPTRTFSADASPGDRQRVAVEQGQDLLHHGRDPAGVEEVLHQVLAGRPDVGDERGVAADRVEERRAAGRCRARPAMATRWMIGVGASRRSPCRRGSRFRTPRGS